MSKSPKKPHPNPSSIFPQLHRWLSTAQAENPGPAMSAACSTSSVSQGPFRAAKCRAVAPQLLVEEFQQVFVCKELWRKGSAALGILRALPIRAPWMSTDVLSSCWSAQVSLLDVTCALKHLCQRLKKRQDNCQVSDFTNLADMWSAGTWCTAIPGCDGFPAGCGPAELQAPSVLRSCTQSEPMLLSLRLSRLGLLARTLELCGRAFLRRLANLAVHLMRGSRLPGLLCFHERELSATRWSLAPWATMDRLHCKHSQATDSEMATFTDLHLQERMQMRSRWWMILLLTEEFSTWPGRRPHGPLRKSFIHSRCAWHVSRRDPPPRIYKGQQHFHFDLLMMCHLCLGAWLDAPLKPLKIGGDDSGSSAAQTGSCLFSWPVEL